MTTALVILALIAVALIGRSLFIRWQESYEDNQFRLSQLAADRRAERNRRNERAGVNRAGEYEWQETIPTE